MTAKEFETSKTSARYLKIITTKNESSKEILSKLLEARIHHVPYASEDALKEYVSWCYNVVYSKNGKLNKSREKELKFVLKQNGMSLRNAIYERFQRGFETVGIPGMKRTLEKDVFLLKTKGRPKKRGHK